MSLLLLALLIYLFALPPSPEASASTAHEVDRVSPRVVRERPRLRRKRCLDSGMPRRAHTDRLRIEQCASGLHRALGGREQLEQKSHVARRNCSGCCRHKLAFATITHRTIAVRVADHGTNVHIHAAHAAETDDALCLQRVVSRAARIAALHARALNRGQNQQTHVELAGRYPLALSRPRPRGVEQVGSVLRNTCAAEDAESVVAKHGLDDGRGWWGSCRQESMLN